MLVNTTSHTTSKHQRRSLAATPPTDSQ